MIIFDIGACVGKFIDYCLSQYDVRKIYAFEPLPVNYEFLISKYKGDIRIVLVNLAVSNFNGIARFYKKPSIDGKSFNFVGNAGCSLRSNKINVCKNIFDEVKVVKLSSFVKEHEINKIDILKIDVEGSEYDIFQDLFDSEIYKFVDQFYFEDHCRKIDNLISEKNNFIKMVKILNIAGKIWMQGDNHQYNRKFNW